jgi:hypothetical protein
METFVKEFIAVLVFALPLVFLYLSGRKKGYEKVVSFKLNTIKYAVITACVFAMLSVPVYFHSSQSYAFYTKQDASVKIAFKHSGKRVVDCDERDVIKKEGERYRQSIKEASRAKMSIEKLSGCPRERHPVVAVVRIDGVKVLDKAYAPTGFKKDLASYISEEFLTAPGVHRILATLTDSGKTTEPDYSLDQTVEIKPAEVKLIRFEDTQNKLVLE